MYIYKITNIINNKVYIGQTINKCAARRWANHTYYLRKNKHDNDHFQRSWNKYGKDAFIFETIEYCFDRDTLDEREKYWIKFYNSNNPDLGYNLELGGNLNKVLTESARKKISEKLKGNKHTLGRIFSEEEKERRRLARIGRPNKLKGRKLSEEFKQFLSNLYKGEKSRFYGKLGMNAKAVYCSTNNKTYPSAVHAAVDTNCDRSTIAKHCRNGGGITKGFHFKFA